jgi:TRAP-type C4-dicarboxylate transport system permease small subunit
MLLFPFLLASSLFMLVGHRVTIGLHLLSMFLTPELRRLLALLADVLSIPQGFRTLRAACLWRSAKHRWLWTKPANLAV